MKSDRRLPSPQEHIAFPGSEQERTALHLVMRLDSLLDRLVDRLIAQVESVEQRLQAGPPKAA